MGKVVVDMSMSVDGCITGANVRPDQPNGEGGLRLVEWAFNSTDPRNRELVAAAASTGAIVVGRNTYSLSIPYWGPDGPTGAARVPTIVLTHRVPEDIPDAGVYTFVDTVDAAYEQAKQAAGDKDIGVSGANTAQQFIKRGHVDEILIHLVPVLFGGGIRLFEHLGTEHVPLEPTEVIETKEVIHLRFRVVK